jgi:hypothetical protein
MKTFKVPDPIVPVVPGSDKPFLDACKEPVRVTFAEFVTNCLLNDPRWIKSFADVKAALAVSGQLANTSVTLDDSDFERLKGCVEMPTNGYQGYHPAVIPQLFPFMKAILEAK